ncbi:MAG: universal stress protein [Mycobacteriaceae bacterium]
MPQAESFTAPFVVVGVDGSRAALRAAVWAIEEARSRDVPLRLVWVAVDDLPDPLPAAVEAVLGTGSDVRLQTETLTGEPAAALLAASGGAVMICVGAAGLKDSGARRVGSTAAALIATAHCPVAVVRGSTGTGGWVVADLDETPDSAAVLQTAVAQARLRAAPLRVLGAWQSRYTDVHDPAAVSDGNRLVRTQLDRRLSQWRSRYPDLDAEPVAVHGGVLEYLSAHSASIQLVVVGARNADAVAELFGPALHDTGCSILVVDRQRLL